MSTTTDTHPLTMMLATAVPLWAADLCSQSLDEVFDRKRIEHLLHVFQENDEAILYRSKIPGKSAESFNALAEGTARLAFCPGGVRCFGMHFEYEIGKWSEGKHGVRDEGSQFLKSTSTIVPNGAVRHELSDLTIKLRQRVGKGRIPTGRDPVERGQQVWKSEHDKRGL